MLCDPIGSLYGVVVREGEVGLEHDETADECEVEEETDVDPISFSGMVAGGLPKEQGGVLTRLG